MTALIACCSVLAYLVVGFVVGRAWGRWHYDHCDWPDGSTRRADATFMYVLGQLFWPVMLPAYGVRRLYENGSVVGLVIPQVAEKERVERARKAEAENRQLRSQIDDLHRQLGIAPLNDRDVS